MKFLSYAWTALKNILKIIVIFAIFQAASTTFETITFALLILVYEKDNNYLFRLASIKQWVIATKRFSYLTKFLGDPKLVNVFTGDQVQPLPGSHQISVDEIDDQAIGEVESQLKKATIDMYISACFSLLIYLVALYQILTALKWF